MVSGPSWSSVLGSVTVSYLSSWTKVVSRSSTWDLMAAGASPASVLNVWARGSAAAEGLPGVAVAQTNSCDLTAAASLQKDPPAAPDAEPVVEVVCDTADAALVDVGAEAEPELLPQAVTRTARAVRTGRAIRRLRLIPRTLDSSNRV